MNLLAHAYLSGDNEHLLVGNFIADHIKGNHINHFPPDVIKGIHLHRAIDHYTDQHPLFNKSCNRLYHRYHKYSGVIVDILYDHFLARRWNHYHDLPLRDFTEQCYGVLLKQYQILPQRTKLLLPHIIMDNWLLAYHSFEGLERSFQGMSKRVRFNPGIEHAVEDLKLNYKGFETDFKDFFPDLVFYVNKKRAEIEEGPILSTRRARRKKRAERFLKKLLRQSDSATPPIVE